MPVIKVNDQPYTLRPGRTRLGSGMDADVPVGDDATLGVQAVVEVVAGNGAGDAGAVVIRRAQDDAAVRINGVLLGVEPTPLLHGDKLEIGGQELFYADDAKTGATEHLSTNDIAAIAAASPAGRPTDATAPTGGRVVSLVDGKEYAIQASGLVIGRDASADIVVADNAVSRKHAEIVAVDSGYELRDHSSNGVFVNNERIDGPRLLARADVIRVGNEELRFYADPLPVSASRAPADEATSSPPPARAHPTLALLEVTNSGPSNGRVHEIRAPLVHVGRGPRNDIVFAEESVSERHATLQRRQDGWYVTDVGSTNGTYVAGTRISGERKLEESTDLRFGGVKTRFRDYGIAAPSADAPNRLAISGRAQLGDTISGPSALAMIAAAAATPRPAAREMPGRAATEPPPRPRVAAWVWVVAVAALIAAVVFLLLSP